MRVLAIRNPWAERIAMGDKTIEVRSRRTLIEERVAIYVTRTPPTTKEVEWIEWLGYTVDHSLSGHIIATVEMYGADRIFDQNQFHMNISKHLCFQNMYREGLWNWHLKNPILLDTFVPFKMKRGAVVWDSIDNELIENAKLPIQ